MALQHLQGKTAIVTGAGSGINFCFANLLLSKGCNVVFADLGLGEEARKVVDSHQADQPRAVFQETDVRSWVQLQRMFTVCEEHFGSADIVCPGAGVFEPPFSAFWNPPGSELSKDPPDGDRYAIMDINLTHPIRTSQLAISHFLKHSKPGSIVHVSSVAGQLAGIVTPLYMVSKRGITAFVQCMAGLETPSDESVKPIRVTAIAPGMVMTPLWTMNEEKLAWVDKEKDAWNTPEEVAEQMLELITRDEYVGGTVLEIGKHHTRVIKLINDPGPDMAALGASKRTTIPTWEKISSKGWGQVPES